MLGACIFLLHGGKMSVETAACGHYGRCSSKPNLLFQSGCLERHKLSFQKQSKTQEDLRKLGRMCKLELWVVKSCCCHVFVWARLRCLLIPKTKTDFAVSSKSLHLHGTFSQTMTLGSEGWIFNLCHKVLGCFVAVSFNPAIAWIVAVCFYGTTCSRTVTCSPVLTQAWNTQCNLQLADAWWLWFRA